MERTEQENPQDPQQQPQTDVDKEREKQKKPMAQENERDDNAVGKVPDPQNEDAERDRRES